MTGRSPMVRLLSRRANRAIIGLFLLIEAIFLTDIFTSQLEQVVKNGGNALQFAFILLLRLPEVVDFALPLVLFLGLYLAINGARSENELMICAAAGERWVQVPRLAMTYGAIGFLLSLAFSGALSPMSSYAVRLTIYEMAATQLLENLENPGTRVQVRQIEDRVVIATPSPIENGRGGLFIFAADESGNAWRVGKANEWYVERPEGSDAYQLKMDGFREYKGQVPPAPLEGARRDLDDLPLIPDPPQLAGAGPPQLAGARITVKRLQLGFTPEDVIRPPNRDRRFTERLLFQTGGPLEGTRTLPDGTEVPSPTRRFGEMLARAIMGLVAAAVAVAAASFSATRLGKRLGLPVGLVLVMAGDVGSRTLMGDAAELGYGWLWPSAGFILFMGLVPCAVYVWLRGETIVAPTRIST